MKSIRYHFKSENSHIFSSIRKSIGPAIIKEISSDLKDKVKTIVKDKWKKKVLREKCVEAI